jgi:hypothetical protein
MKNLVYCYTDPATFRMGERTIFCETIDRFEKSENAPVVKQAARTRAFHGSAGTERADCGMTEY